ncbi:hypothetical protein BvCmsL112A_04547 [Escherichia coli]|nr:hypothetical protein BvCmsL112A_04547 [Escherichia coli]GDU14407.1 hypothetical protein BvCmsSINP009_00829 [Escherichia coli]
MEYSLPVVMETTEKCATGCGYMGFAFSLEK